MTEVKVRMHKILWKDIPEASKQVIRNTHAAHTGAPWVEPPDDEVCEYSEPLPAMTVERGQVFEVEQVQDQKHSDKER